MIYSKRIAEVQKRGAVGMASTYLTCKAMQNHKREDLRKIFTGEERQHITMAMSSNYPGKASQKVDGTAHW